MYNQLLDVGTTDLIRLQLGDLDDLNGTEAGTMTSSHIHV